MENGTVSYCHLVAGVALVLILVLLGQTASSELRYKLEITSQWIHAILVLLVAVGGLVLTA